MIACLNTVRMIKPLVSIFQNASSWNYICKIRRELSFLIKWFVDLFYNCKQLQAVASSLTESCLFLLSGSLICIITASSCKQLN